MTIEPRNVGWGSYQNFEGPFFRGTASYVLPENPSEADLDLLVLTTTEGGRYDAINMYDRCIMSAGLIQWCEASQNSTSDLIGHIADKVGTAKVLSHLKPALDLTKSTFKKNKLGKWRFFFLDERGETNSLQKQRDLWLGGSSGLKNDPKTGWTPVSKEVALTWAACVSNLLNDPVTHKAQVEFTHARLRWFYTNEAKRILLEDKEPNVGWAGAFRAAYNSFAGNLPTVASAQLVKATAKLKSPKWSPNWCIGVLQQLTFGPEIAIYPHRYDKIRPILEKYWPVDLPKTSEDLRAWVEPEVVVTPVSAHEPTPEPPVTPPQVVQPPEPVTVPSDQSPIPDPPTPEGLIAFIVRLLGAFFGRK